MGGKEVGKDQELFGLENEDWILVWKKEFMAAEIEAEKEERRDWSASRSSGIWDF